MTYTGFDISPSSLRWSVRDDVSAEPEVAEPIYGIRGCKTHVDKGYDSATSWSDPLEFRESVFGAKFASGAEKTVDYEEPDGNADKWLRSFFQSAGRHPFVDVAGTIAVAVPDHASPEERDNVLSGMAATKYANVSLVWRPVAALLSWLNGRIERNFDVASLVGRRIFVLDLDGGRPELTLLTATRHRKMRDWIIPSRMRPKKGSVSADDEFVRTSYRETLGDVEGWEQIVRGQFFAEVQQKLEEGAPSVETWVRKDGAWTPKTVGFAGKISEGVLDYLRPILKAHADALNKQGFNDQDVFLLHGWLARRYAEVFKGYFGACGIVEVLAADAVADGAALFAQRLAKGLPTFYDRLPEYCFWDGFKAQWVQMFDGEQEVEPGCEYWYPVRGEEVRRLKIEKFADNVSFYVREPTSGEYARRIKTDFAEFLRSDLELGLSAVVSPEKGSARFALEMCDPSAPAIFVSGKTTVREIVLRWRSDDNANKSVSVQFIREHQGFVEPQPVLGRIYDSEDNLRLVETYLSDKSGAEHQRLWRTYSAKFSPRRGNGIADRVGYSAQPRREPTRGLFGTKYMPNARIDAAAHAFAARCSEEQHYLSSEGMKLQNYCHGSAMQAYKDMLRREYAKGTVIDSFNYYYAPGYVLGDQPDDLVLLMKYIYAKPMLGGARCKLWWAFFRMLCWHPECKLRAADLGLLEDCLAMIVEQDAGFAASSGRYAANEMKFVILAILYALRIRESGVDLSEGLKDRLVALLTHGDLRDLPFPSTMVPKMDDGARRPGDTLSKYVVRFIRFEDTLEDRELGAAMGGV